MLRGLSKNGRLEVTQFSVPTTSGTVSVIRRDAKLNMFGLTAPDCLKTCPMCEGQRWTFKAVATRAEIYSRSDEAKLDDVSCLGYVDVGQLSGALLRSW